MTVPDNPTIEPPKKPPIAVFQLSFFSRKFAETFLVKAYDAPIAAKERELAT
jgi:hypothetical protein